MKNLKVGMYARVKFNEFEKIVRVRKIDNDGFKADDNMYYLFDDLISYSSNIVKIIYYGDYVNGELVCSIETDENGKTWLYTNSDHHYGILSDEIESVVTKEQFDAITYRVR